MGLYLGDKSLITGGGGTPTGSITTTFTLSEDLEELLTKPHSICKCDATIKYSREDVNSASSITYPLTDYLCINDFTGNSASSSSSYSKGASTISNMSILATFIGKQNGLKEIVYGDKTYYGCAQGKLIAFLSFISTSSYRGIEHGRIKLKAIILNTTTGLRTIEYIYDDAQTYVYASSNGPMHFDITFPIASDEYLLYAELTDAN